MKPYVYIIQNKDRTHWYVGYKQKPKAGEDYWGSSDYLDELIAQTGKENWTKTIVKEFDTWQEAKAHEDELLELMWDWPGRVNKNINGYVDYTDPQVKEKHKAGCQKNAQNPDWQANVAAGNQKKAQDPEWRANHKAGCQKLAQDPVWQSNVEAANQKKAQDPEWRANHKAGCQKRSQNPEYLAKNKAANQKRAKPFIATRIATGEEYFCEKLSCDQAKELKLGRGAVSDCLNGKYKQHKGFTFRYV